MDTKYKLLNDQGNHDDIGLIQQKLKECWLMLLIVVGSYLTIAILSYHPQDPGWSHSGSSLIIKNHGGFAGAWISDALLSLVGYLAYLLPPLLFLEAFNTYRSHNKTTKAAKTNRFWGPALGLLLGSVSTSAMFSLTIVEINEISLPLGSGGLIGLSVLEFARPLFGDYGCGLLLVGLMITSVIFYINSSLFSMLDFVLNETKTLLSFTLDYAGRATFHLKLLGKHFVLKLINLMKLVFTHIKKLLLYNNNFPQNHSDTKEHAKLTVAQPSYRSITKPADLNKQQEKIVSKSSHQQTEKTIPENHEDHEQTESDASFPEIALLDQPISENKHGYSDDELCDFSKLLEAKLKDFNIDAKVVSVQPGPVITLFEIQPAAGIKVSRISTLAKDLARSLAVSSVRVVELIPGKSVVGIEIPNEHRDTIFFRELIHCESYQQEQSPLTIALGQSINGEPIFADIASMPHLLVAGTTGSGKSVGINAMILSMLYKATPDEVRFLFIDPKMLELSIYEGIPHLLSPVVTDMKKAANGLCWCVAEMERRYKLMTALGVRNLDGFNKKVSAAAAVGKPMYDPIVSESEGNPQTLKPLPYIVVVIDEFADMMMIVGKKVEILIARIAQKARAAGIHLILATQRPSVDVITGLIKANIPARLSFLVSSKIDSRTIIDQAGAEQLLGHGDMLFLPPGKSIPIRIHGAFVSDDEVHRVVNAWKEIGNPKYVEDILSQDSENDVDSSSDNENGDEQDALYDEAVNFVLESQKASISSLQRRLRIGYNRAARMIEYMEKAGVVSVMDSSGNREILVPTSSVK